jgi:hypothetical protein
MKFNQWTLGLAALGVVSLASAAKAEEKMNAVQAALSSTTISGYVDTSIQWNPGTGNASVAPVSFQGPGKADGFNLNVVQLTIANALDESEWASGYRADLWFGPDANSLGSQSINAGASKAASGDFAIRQAYVALRTPVGNGIDWKVGVFDTVLGYETLESGSNPHYTHSYGFTIEPTTHTGILGTYRVNDIISFSAGIANTFGPTINERGHGINTGGPRGRTMAESHKTLLGSIALTAPSDWGWAAGSTLYAGIVHGYNNAPGDKTTSLYVGGTLATPVTGLKVGVAFDYITADDLPSGVGDNIWTVGAYGSYQASEKLSFHGRAEYLQGESNGTADDLELFGLTATVQYDLWENVISRLEVRWDHCMDGPGGTGIFGGQTSSGYASSGFDGSSYAEGFSDGYIEGYFDGLEDGDLEATSKGSSYYSLTDSMIGSSFGAGNFGTGGERNAVLVALQFIYKF